MDVMDSVESKRVSLETNLTKLESALKHWRTWDVEYEGLKEEMSGLDESTGDEGILKVANDFGGDLLTPKEIETITRLDGKTSRRPRQIVDLITRRQDYVQQNISTISKQLALAEKSLSDLDSEQTMDGMDAGGLPVSEIIEELDDDDNVISSRIQNPEHTTAQLVDTLRKAGVTGLDDAGTTDPTTSQAAVASSVDSTRANEGKRTALVTEPTHPTPTPSSQSVDSKRTAHVRPAMDSSSDVAFDSLENFLAPPDASSAGARTISKPVNESLIQGSFKPGAHVFELDEEDELLGASAVLPKTDTPEEAKLRREMLQYHLNEVGNVVAEIDLLEGSSDDDEDIDELQDLQDLDAASLNSDVSEEEDAHGRRTTPAVTAQYRKKMRDLEQRLNGDGGFLVNAGPSAATPTQATTAPPARGPITARLPVRTSIPPKATPAVPRKKKSVRFAEELDMSSPPPPRSPPTTTSAPPSPAAPILAPSVQERAPAPRANAEEGDEQGFDPELQRRQLAARYYEMRNEAVRREGGFRVGERDREEPLLERTADGGTRKVSRFKAARLGG